ncbi:MAG: exo-beta-1,3-glucanase [Anaerolineae bacterium]|nr:exo-beta-1,3-glucanase [Anaerolineae bacterium]MDW8071490.1 exo-beta-1,3-glucanase [Anaerolineae bacterium]
MSHGVLNGLEHIFDAARQRGLKVIAIIWLDADAPVDNASIAKGIEEALQHPDTILRISCGSELRLRVGTAVAEPVIRDCLQRFRNAGVSQPLGYIDTWWEWCNAAWPCQEWDLADAVDWIGINVFPWWENKYSELFPCIPAEQVADFHTARLRDLMNRYPEKEVLLTEFGWPACPERYSETNQHTGQQCGVAGETKQRLVIEDTLIQLEQANLPGIVFEAFREPWKLGTEGVVGPCWGICDESPPYRCRFPYGLRERAYLPMVLK